MKRLLTILSLAAPSLAAADGPATVFLARVQAPALEEVTRRVAPELTAAGYRVSFEGCAPGLDDGCAQPWPTGTPAIAAVDFSWAGDGLAIEARVARADRRTVRLGTVVVGVPSPEASVVAVRTAELVRAGVLAVMRAPQPTVEALAAVPPSPAPSAGFFVALGPGLIQSVAGLGSALGPSLHAGITWRRAWFGAVWIVSPTLSGSVSTVEGKADLRNDIGGAELGRRWRPSPLLQPAVAVGGGLYHLQVRGKDVAPLASATSGLWTPFVSASGGLAIPLGQHWAVHAELRAAVTRRAPLVRVGDTEAGRTGWPLLVATVALAYQR